jgi:hypothetical protein
LEKGQGIEGLFVCVAKEAIRRWRLEQEKAKEQPEEEAPAAGHGHPASNRKGLADLTRNYASMQTDPSVWLAQRHRGD